MADTSSPYRVLARKYRPRDFSELIGQEALVRTLKNAIDSNRIAHGFMLTGVRGVGKTTTARIIARALNYTGPEGKSGPTTGPTDDCEVCRAIAEDRHPDVIEMDAASHTKVEEMRQLLDGVRYAPVSARYKIYIIDEVHMLSDKAFNALLKTLEEPPPHVKFIFATTEIRKVPVTVLSRCQRFDLRRVDIPVLEQHYKSICQKENVNFEDEAITMIARAADGSVRDGLSLLDQAMALGMDSGITAGLVQNMLGLADRGRVLNLLENALEGNTAAALEGMSDLHRLGADPFVVMNDLLELTHLMTRLRVAPKTKDLPAGLSPESLTRAMALSGKMSMPTLGRTWQILLKGLAEVNVAPNPQAAAEMVLIRLIYAADLPDPADLIKRLKDYGDSGAHSGASKPSTAVRAPEPVALRAVAGGGQALASSSPMPIHIQDQVEVASLRDIVDLLERNREVMWAGQIRQFARLVKIQPGWLELQLDAGAHPKLAAEIKRLLSTLTGQSWMVSVSNITGSATLAEQDQAVLDFRLQQAAAHPVVAEILDLFPGSILDVQKITK